MHENCNSGEPVAWRPGLREVTGADGQKVSQTVGGERRRGGMVLMCCPPFFLFDDGYNLSTAAFNHLTKENGGKMDILAVAVWVPVKFLHCYPVMRIKSGRCFHTTTIAQWQTICYPAEMNSTRRQNKEFIFSVACGLLERSATILWYYLVRASAS